MNSDPEPSAFFPPLPSLLSGSSRLTSFQTALNAFTVAPEAAAENTQLEKFCYDAPTFSLLATCPDSLPKPSAKSKSDYEARTAPIQVSGSQNGDYDLEQMKQDAQELSGQLGVEESFALRVVILEWQSRAEEQLLDGGEDANRAVALSASMMSKSVTRLNGSVNGLVKPALDFADETIRRRRQLDIYLKERSSRLKLGAALLGREGTRNESDEPKTWIDDLARQISKERFNLHTDAPTTDQVLSKCMTSLEERIQMLDDMTKLPKIAQASEEMMLMYAAATFNDIVSLMRLLLVALGVHKDVPTSSVVLSWFQKLESVNYFLALPSSPAWSDTTELQCLISLISFTILDASATATAAKLQDMASPGTGAVSYPCLGTAGYFEDENCVGELNLIFYRAALNDISILCPAILAWTIVILPIRNVARRHTERRDRMLDEGSSDNETPGRRRSSRRESRMEPSLFEKLYAALQSMELEPEVKDDPAVWFAEVAVQGVFSVVAQLTMSMASIYSSSFELPLQQIVRSTLLQLLSAGMSVVSYEAEVLEAILAVLTPETVADLEASDDISSQLCSNFISDDTFRRQILDQTLIRYPFELSPMLRLLASLASARNAMHDIMELVEKLQTLTIMVPEHFNAYSLENEEENANDIRIDQDLHLFVSRQALSWYGPNHVSRRALTMGTGEEPERGARIISIPAGSKATVLKESRPMVLKLQHAHSGLEYLAMLLSTRLPNSEMCVEPNQPPLDLATAADIVALINAFLGACFSGRRAEKDSQWLLQRFSDALPVEKDITFVLTELLESELVAHLDQTAQDGSLDLLIACAEYFALLVKADSGRVWTALARSSLLGLNGGTNALAAVVGTMETALGQFRFLSACTSLYSNLIGDAVGGLIKRKATEQPVRRGRFDSPMERSEYTPERTMQRVMNTFTGVMLEAWESLGEWRFTVPDEKSGIAAKICDSFSLLIKATYGLQDTEDSDMQKVKNGRVRNEQRLAGMLLPAADAVLEVFAPTSGSTTSIRSFTAAFASAAAVLQGSSATADFVTQIRMLRPTIKSLVLLLRTFRMQDKEGNRACAIATQLLKAMPYLVVIFTTEPSLKGSIATLFAEITISLSSISEQSDPPSLLGQMSSSSAKAFLTVLSQLDRPLCDVATERQIWAFLSAVMKGRQQWLALYLLTGTVPKERLSASTTQKANSQGNSLLAYALGQLSRVADLAPERSIALLGFVSAAQGASIWASTEVRNHTNFLQSIVDWLHDLQHVDTRGNKAEQVLRTRETRKASLVCEVLAQAVHSSVEVGDQAVLKMLKGKLGFLSSHGHAVDAYNRSLHRNLTDNFRARFCGVEVDAFRRSAANLIEGGGVAGMAGAYDLDIMDLALGHEWAWAGSTDRGGKSSGFRDEASRANVNFGLLEAQRGLLGSWSALATTLVESLAGMEEGLRVELSESLAKGVTNALEANAAANLDVPETDKVVVMRAQMSFVVLSKLASEMPTPEIRAILPAAHRALRASPADFDIATQEEDLHHYRLGLQILVLAVQPHVHSAPKSTASSRGNVKATDETPLTFLDPAVAAALADIVRATVAPTWRALAGNLHTNIACALPGDFALVVALLQAVLAVPGSAVAHTQMAEVVASWQLVRSALSLYSWSDRLAEATGDAADPVYGELAMQFLRVLSTIKPVAEHIALESALPQLAAANLSSYLRKPGGKGPFDEPRRMFGIWSEGMLPLCLNLLDAVGPPVAGEVGAFLNEFALQLERANTALENREPSKFQPHAGAVTLGIVQEAHALCLISMILRSDSARAAAEGIEFSGSTLAVNNSSGDGEKNDVGPLQGYEHRKIVSEAQGLLRSKASLAARISAATGVEMAWQARMLDAVDSVLTRRVFAEVEAVAGLFEEREEDGS